MLGGNSRDSGGYNSGWYKLSGNSWLQTWW